MRIDSFRDKRVTVMGLGRFGGGVGVARWLAAQGARVLVTDKEPREALADSVAALADQPIQFRLGEHVESDFRETDLVIANPAVPDRSPYLQTAVAAGVPITTEINLFVERCPARTIGITGSVGKSTTAAMTGHILSACYSRGKSWLGGNIGKSLLDTLPRISPEDCVVLELSSFQLHRTPLVRWSPHVAVVTNITPNHLDWHGDFASYMADKLNIVRFQNPAADHIVIEDTPVLTDAFTQLFGDLAGVWRYRLDDDGRPLAIKQSASAVDADDRVHRWPGLTLDVPGRHNRFNAAAALSAALCIGIDPAAAAAALATFEALPHRLCRVATIDGVAYYDDSKSTTPEAALMAMQSIDSPLLIILGGYDKGSDLRPLAAAAAGRAKFVACIGATGRDIAAAVSKAGGRAEYLGELPTAVAACRAVASPGDAVVLSPACASWDQFEDYRQRGELFARLVRPA
jgi:UDP-N-acetylmuramoylalanine--D-glutamate ligase